MSKWCFSKRPTCNLFYSHVAWIHKQTHCEKNRVTSQTITTLKRHAVLLDFCFRNDMPLLVSGGPWGLSWASEPYEFHLQQGKPLESWHSLHKGLERCLGSMQSFKRVGPLSGVLLACQNIIPFNLKNNNLILGHIAFLAKCYPWQASQKLSYTVTYCLQLIPFLAMSKGRKNLRRVSAFDMPDPALWRSTPHMPSWQSSTPQTLQTTLSKALRSFPTSPWALLLLDRKKEIRMVHFKADFDPHGPPLCWRRRGKGDNSGCHLYVCLCGSVWACMFPGTVCLELYLCEITGQGDFPGLGKI